MSKPFQITLKLPRNRTLSGVLYLYNPEGVEIFSAAARGKADNARATRADNPRRDPTRPYGDTPSGDFRQTRIVIFDQPHSRMGRGWIPLEGMGGDALRAKEGGRSGLGIHAGRGDVRLIATYGCVRLRDHDFDFIASRVGDAPLGVTIEDI